MPKGDIGRIALSAFKRFGLEDNYPEIRIVDSSHPLIGGKRIARAVKYESGPDAIYINKRYLNSDPAKLDEYLQHEASHIATWRKYGPQVKEHGKEWSAICRALASSRRVCNISR